MATEESNIVQRCRMAASKGGARIFRNNRGMFLTLDCIRIIRDAATQFGVKGVLDVIRSGRLRKVRAGLEVPGSSDLIGWQTVRITQDMVGRDIAVFLAAEVKRPEERGRTGGGASVDQQRFVNNVNKAGGKAGIVYSPEDMAALLNRPF